LIPAGLEVTVPLARRRFSTVTVRVNCCTLVVKVKSPDRARFPAASRDRTR
jgi:hypothetical protein